MIKNKIEQTKSSENDDKKQHSQKGHLLQNIQYKRQMKRIAFAFSSALMIGIIFGVVILNMVKQEEQHLPSLLHAKTETEKAEERDTPVLDPIESLQIYVIQGGLFTEQENSKKWENKFRNMNVPVLIWERSDDYYLLAGIAHSHDDAKELAHTIKETGLDVFVKEWEVVTMNDSYTDEEYEWVQTFISFFDNILSEKDNPALFTLTHWEKNISFEESESLKINAFNQTMEKQLNEETDLTIEEMQHLLLYALYQFEQIFHNS